MRRALILLLALAACSSSPSGPVADPTPSTVAVVVTDRTCTLDRSSVPAGPVTFQVSSQGAVAGSEVELLDGFRVLGEEESVHDGHVGGFAQSLKAGSLQVLCLAGGQKVTHAFTVTASKPRHLTKEAAARQALLKTAAAAWQTWVLSQLDQLVPATKAFDDAVRAGDLARAKALYAPARVFYERVEPVAESFGDLDPSIDARIDDVDDPAQWTGFHRLEKAVFADGSLAGLGPQATLLDINVAKLASLAKAITVTPADLAGGAQALLEEVARTKITGEEERYSHVDLVDLSANVEGASKAFSLLEPALATRDRALASLLTARFASLTTLIAGLRTGPGPTDFPSYEKVTTADRKLLADAVDAVAEPYAQVPALLVV